MMMECVAAGRAAVFSIDNRIEDGQLVLGDQPGLGLAFDAKRLQACAVNQPSPGAGPSPWGRRRVSGTAANGEGGTSTENL